VQTTLYMTTKRHTADRCMRWSIISARIMQCNGKHSMSDLQTAASYTGIYMRY